MFPTVVSAGMTETEEKRKKMNLLVTWDRLRLVSSIEFWADGYNASEKNNTNHWVQQIKKKSKDLRNNLDEYESG